MYIHMCIHTTYLPAAALIVELFPKYTTDTLLSYDFRKGMGVLGRCIKNDIIQPHRKAPQSLQ